MQPEFGFRERAHTADWELEVWAPNLGTLLEQAGRGMYTLAGVQLDTSSAQKRFIDLRASDAESLLVRFLSELLWLEQEQGLAFDEIILQLDENYHLQAVLRVSPVTHLDKEIKAVTYHNLKVEKSAKGLQVNIVFDV